MHALIQALHKCDVLYQHKVSVSDIKLLLCLSAEQALNGTCDVMYDAQPHTASTSAFHTPLPRTPIAPPFPCAAAPTPCLTVKGLRLPRHLCHEPEAEPLVQLHVLDDVGASDAAVLRLGTAAGSISISISISRTSQQITQQQVSTSRTTSRTIQQPVASTSAALN